VTAAAPLARYPALRKLAAPLLFVAAFVLFVVWSFPYDDLARRLEQEARAAGGDLVIEKLGAGGLLGVTARGVKLRLPAAPGVEASPELRFDRVDARVDLLPLLLRRVSFAWAVEGYGGRARGRGALAKDQRLGPLESLTLDTTDLDVQKLPARELIGLELGGRVAAKVDLPQMLPPDQASGRAAVTFKGMAITGGAVRGFTLPKLSLGDVEAGATIEKGLAKIERTTARNGDVEAEVSGTIRMKPLLSLSQADLNVRFKPSDAWLNANPMLRGLLSAVGNARQPDGSYLFTLTGPLSNIASRPGR